MQTRIWRKRNISVVKLSGVLGVIILIKFWYICIGIRQNWRCKRRTRRKVLKPTQWSQAVQRFCLSFHYYYKFVLRCWWITNNISAKELIPKNFLCLTSILLYHRKTICKKQCSTFRGKKMILSYCKNNILLKPKTIRLSHHMKMTSVFTYIFS